MSAIPSHDALELVAGARQGPPTENPGVGTGFLFCHNAAPWPFAGRHNWIGMVADRAAKLAKP